MRAGERNERVTLQVATSTRDEYGAERLSWQDVRTVWAKITILNGREVQLADRPVMNVIYRVEMLAGLTVTHLDRLRWNNKYLSVESVEPLPRGFLTLRCLETAMTADSSGTVGLDFSGAHNSGYLALL